MTSTAIIGILISASAVLVTIGIFILTKVFESIKKSSATETNVGNMQDAIKNHADVINVVKDAVTNIDKNMTRMVSEMSHFNNFQVTIETHNNMVAKKFDEHQKLINDLELKIATHIGEYTARQRN